jgi:seryl-tRNA synthetase
VSKVPVNFRLDRDLLDGARAQAEREGITLVKLLERSLSNELGLSTASDVKTNVKTNVKTVEEVIDVKTIVETAVNTVKTELENVKTDLENVKAELESVKTNVKTVEAAINVKTIVETDVNTVKTELANVKTTTAENKSVSTGVIEPVTQRVTADDRQPLETTTVSWGKFHSSIGLSTPPSKSSAAGKKAVKVAIEQGLGQWRYDSSSKEFVRF